MTTLSHLDWQPVILLKIVRLPFSTWDGLSLKRAYVALNSERLLYADWTLEANQRAENVVCATGWILPRYAGTVERRRRKAYSVGDMGAALQRQPVCSLYRRQRFTHPPHQVRRNPSDRSAYAYRSHQPQPGSLTT